MCINIHMPIQFMWLCSLLMFSSFLLYYSTQKEKLWYKFITRNSIRFSTFNLNDRYVSVHLKLFIKDVGMDITTNKLNWQHRYTTPWRIHHTILLLSWQTTKPYGYFCTFKTDIAIPLPRLLITACNAKPIIFIPVTDVTIRLPVLSMTSYHNCTQFALIGDTLTDISSLIHVRPSW